MSQPILEVSGLGIRFGALAAVDDVSFVVQPGSITSVIGPNGAGKSTLFNLISGAIRPLTGRVLLEGREVTGQPPHQMLRAGLSRSFQITNLFFELSVRENLRQAAQFLEGGAGQWRSVQRSTKALERVEELIEQFHLQAKVDEIAGVLSHGEQRRLEIAVALASRPRVLLLDEPTQGMSHVDTQETEAMIRNLAGPELTVMLVEHDVELVMSLSNHVVVMHQGRLLAQGAPLAVRGDPRVQAAYFGDHLQDSHHA
jgi:branched-chain amino acid transport system ATP-binding protein